MAAFFNRALLMPSTEPVTRLAMKKLRKPPSFMKPMIT